jgi:Family of unknown function (DUF5343)
MATKLPYVISPTSVSKILEKVKQAQTPERFTGDFLSTKLGFKGGNNRQFIPLAKKLGLLGSDGKPSDIYKQFRNPSQSGASIAAAMKLGYRELFERNEYAGSLPKDQLKGLVVEITGLDAKDRVVQLICQTFDELKKLADFDAKAGVGQDKTTLEDGGDKTGKRIKSGSRDDEDSGHDIGLNLAYTINLVLPKSDDPAVFNAIFKSLRDNLLRK